MAFMTEMVFNYVVEYLSPQEYDGTAQIVLPRNDKRLRVSALLQWERDNAARVVEQRLVPMTSFFASLKARDKLGRFFQYLFRLLQGLLERSGHQRHLLPIVKKLILTLSNARRTFRVMEFGPLLTLARGVSTVYQEEPFWAHALGAMALQALFNLTDRLRWLQEHQLVSGDYRTTGRTAMRALCACHALQCLRRLLHAASIHLEVRAGEGKGNGRSAEGLDERRAEMRTFLRDALKQWSCCLQCAHIGKVPYLQSNDVAVGLMGVATTASDLRDIWLARK